MEKYLHYNIEDFATENSFINWVNNSDDKDTLFWEEWLIANPSKQQTIAEAKELVSLLSQNETKPEQGIQDKIWDKINLETAGDTKVHPLNSTKSGSRRNFLKYLIPLAAAVIGIISFINLPSETTDFNTLKTEGDIQKVDLNDGTTVFLNKNTTLKHGLARGVHLEGEAFFEVTKGDKFTVVTELGNVEVLGTSFNVYARNSQFSVFCKTGKVRVTQNGNEIAMLTPNQGVKSIDQKIIKIVNEERAWRDGNYRFDNADIISVLEEIEQAYNVSIDHENIPPQKYSGSLDTNNSLEENLQKVLWPLRMSYKVNGKKIIIEHE